MNSPSESATRRKNWPTPANPEVRLLATVQQRLPSRLDQAPSETPEAPTIQELVSIAREHPDADGWILDGGEPTLRQDFPQLIRALSDAGAPRLGMTTDGLALTNPKVVAMLKKLGLTRVRIRLAGARHDAHDWLYGKRGVWRRAVKALSVCVAGGLETEVEMTVTRPTRPYLLEAVELFARLGVTAVLLRRVTARGEAKKQDVALAPRFGLMAQDLDAAVQSGARRGLRIMVEGIPNCVAPGTAAHRVATDAVIWSGPSSDEWQRVVAHYALPDAEPGCAKCPGQPACCGAPSDYVRRFGRTEIDSESNHVVNPGSLPPTPNTGGEDYPPYRSGRFPPARLSYVRLAARLPSLTGDPLVALRPSEEPDVYRTIFVAPSRVSDAVLGDQPGPAEAETTREARVRLVKLAQFGARTLRIASAGTLSHPQAAELLREATRLQFDRVEVAGEASALDAFSNMQMRRLRGITRMDVALFGPDAARHDAVMGRPGAFDETMRALDRLANLVPNMHIGAYAVLTDHTMLHDFAEAWDFGDLPGEPFFRLAPRGGDLVALAQAAAELEEGPARDAIAAVLPVALFARNGVMPAPQAQTARGDFPAIYAAPSGSDRYGCYTGRPNVGPDALAGACPGYAVGWTAEGHEIPLAEGA